MPQQFLARGNSIEPEIESEEDEEEKQQNRQFIGTTPLTQLSMFDWPENDTEDIVVGEWKQHRLNTDPGQTEACQGESDGDVGEDMGEDGFTATHNQKLKAKKNIRNLHKYRERIQVLNEDLNVLIFDGEEDIDEKMYNQNEQKENNEN